MAEQMRQPSGWFGSQVISRLMNLGNRQIVDRAVALLEIHPQHRVLEIGFGGGAGLARLAQQLQDGIVTGVDFSADMVLRAERRFRKEIAAGRLKVQLGDVSRLPYTDESFDRGLTVNTIYFWPDTLKGLGEIRRVLKPQGCVAIGIRSKEKMSKHQAMTQGFRLFSTDELAGLMQTAGFRILMIEHRDQERIYDQVIVVGSNG